jgi:type IV pilus assembly protein PilF
MNILRTGLLFLSLALGGCVVTETEDGQYVHKIDEQKVLENHVKLGLAYVGSDNREMAIKHLRDALAIDSKSAGAHFGFAVLYQSEGELKLADENYRAAIQYDPKYTQARFYYAAYLFGQERYPEAYEQFERVTNDVDYVHRARAFVNLGVTGVKLGEQIKAKADFERAIRLKPSSPLAYLELALLAYESSDFVDSRKYLEDFNRLSRPNSKSLWLGVRLEHLFKNTDAESSYGLALKNMFPKSKENLAYQKWLKNERNK